MVEDGLENTGKGRNIKNKSDEKRSHGLEQCTTTIGLELNSEKASSSSPELELAENTHRINLSRDKIKKYFKCPQGLAARFLGVSISTLKRRFYDLEMGRWPYQSIPLEQRKKGLYYLINEVEPNNPKHLTDESIAIIQAAFRSSLQNKPGLNYDQYEDKTKKMDYQFLSYVPNTNPGSLRQHYQKCGKK
ncbi:hypothetical protein AKO1_011786 [Acrasis kona]|uniref:RWP-RK domain-containing protein n=1 Tax=Acrasis kona TaxID=1008807 RepID=A0AAW2Z610_9EUKA